MAYLDRVLPANDLPIAARASGPLTYPLFSVAGMLGQRQRSPAWICRYLDQLIEHEGFPPPLPLLTRGGLTRSAHRRSEWLRDAVDAWLGGQAPPPLAPAIDEAARSAAGARMDARARRLYLVDAA
jgi:hypothetical protein